MGMNILKFIAWLAEFAALAGCFYGLAAAFLVGQFAARPRLPAGAGPPVTMLKPLCGEDPGLYDNLASFCAQNYPTFQILCGVQDPGDPAIETVKRLQSEYPERDITLVVDSQPHGQNLKVANLINMLPKARHDLLVVVDSDMRAAEDFLSVAVGPLADSSVGLVTFLYRGVAATPILWSQLATLHINHGFLPQALAGEALQPRVATFGAAMAFRRVTLEAAGGFAAVADTLADDNALGAAIRRQGKSLAVAPLLLDNWLTEPSLAAMFRHELRWSLTIRRLSPWGYAGSVITHAVALAVLAVTLGGLAGNPGSVALAVLIIALLSRFAMVRIIDRALALPRTQTWLIPVRDLLSFAVFVASFCTRTVAWRNRRFRVDRQGQLTLGS